MKDNYSKERIEQMVEMTLDELGKRRTSQIDLRGLTEEEADYAQDAFGKVVVDGLKYDVTRKMTLQKRPKLKLAITPDHHVSYQYVEARYTLEVRGK